MRRGLGWVAPLVLLVLARAGEAAPEVEARLSRSSVAIGEPTTLEVAVQVSLIGSLMSAEDPQFELPRGVEVLSRGRVQNVSWINGRSSGEIVFRYELGAWAAGQFTLGPFRVRAGSRWLSAPAVTLTVTAAATRLGGGGSGPASLLVDVEPRSPYVGQPVLLRVRLVQRATLAEDPQYVPPPTPGFWAEPASRPESYYAAEGNQRVLVTETRARLYPLAAGRAGVGEAVARLALLGDESLDPSRWTMGQVPRREVTVRSTPLAVAVRALPPGAPAGFDGAVGALSVTWSADRAQTPRDVPATVRLEIRGIGNLPLIRTPAWSRDDLEVFAATVDDSFGTSGSASPGRRRFRWTVLPRHPGRLSLQPPVLVWFDPTRGSYLRADASPIVLDVGPPLSPEGGGREGFPEVFLDHPLRPLGRPPEPWAYALAGLGLGSAIGGWRRAGRVPRDAGERAKRSEWLRAVGPASGPDFWRAADEAARWIEARGHPVQALRRAIESARYGGAAADAEPIRSRLTELLSQALPAPASSWPWRVGAGTLAVAGLALCVGFGPRPGDPRATVRGRAADDAARAGDVARAHAAWAALWREGCHDAGLAARLAWSEARAGAIGPATVWVLAGERDEPRDPALGWVRARVREGGGLTGAAMARLPVRKLEWSLLALLLSAAAAVGWPRALRSAAAAALALACALAVPAEDAWAARAQRAVVRTPITLGPSGIELEPGQVVRILGQSTSRVRVAVGPDLSGWLPAGALLPVEGLR